MYYLVFRLNLSKLTQYTIIMTTQEMSNEFDILWNNIMSNQAPGLDEYEKSVFLTQAQEEIVTQLYNGTLGDGFESTEQNREYLRNLITSGTYDVSPPDKPYSFEYNGLYTCIQKLSPELLVIVSEYAKLMPGVACAPKEQGKSIPVVPIKYDNLSSTLNNPFRGANYNRVIRIDEMYHEPTKYVKLISKDYLSSYNVTYLRKPDPIILKDLPNDLTIDGQSSEQGCTLDSSLHRIILKYAVNLAAAAWTDTK